MPGDRLVNGARVSPRQRGQSTIGELLAETDGRNRESDLSANLRWALKTRELTDCRIGVHASGAGGRGFESHRRNLLIKERRSSVEEHRKSLIQHLVGHFFFERTFVACLNFASSVWWASSAKISASPSCERRERTSALAVSPQDTCDLRHCA